MFYVFIDTQVVQQQAFGFRNTVALVALENAVKDGRVTVLLTDVTDREIKSHIPDVVTKSLQQVKKQFVLQVLTNVSFDQWRKLDEASAVKNALDEWQEYKSRVQAKMIPIDLVKPSIVMDAYFEQQPPFSAKKPNEFRDAFVLEALRAWADKEQASVIVVSGDGDHSESCDGEVLIHTQTILEALALTFDDDAKLESAREQLETEKAALLEQVHDKLTRLPITIDDDYEADIEDVRVNSVDFDPQDFELAEVRDGQLLLSGPVTIPAEVDATVADYDNGASEDGDWAYLPYNEVTYLPEIEARLAIRMPFTRSKVGAIAEVIIEKPKDLELAGHRCRVRMRKHWSDGDGPDEPDVSTSDQSNNKSQRAEK